MMMKRRRPRRVTAARAAVAAVYTSLYLILIQESQAASSKGTLDVQSFCRRTLVKVTRVVLLCDSPGAYYYGSNTYRNSEVCMSNDKANIAIYCKCTGGWLQVGVYLQSSWITTFSSWMFLFLSLLLLHDRTQQYSLNLSLANLHYHTILYRSYNIRQLSRRINPLHARIGFV
jgi:hypothetical protein